MRAWAMGVFERRRGLRSETFAIVGPEAGAMIAGFSFTGRLAASADVPFRCLYVAAQPGMPLVMRVCGVPD
jgi:hypothetical protein